MTIRIMLVDDHTMVRSGLALLLAAFDDLVLVGQASDGQEAIDQCLQLQPDVVLMDLLMPKLDGIEATRTILRAQPQLKIIALTSYKEDELVYSALQAGAISYLLKNATADELVQAIRAAHEGKPTLAPEATQALLKAATRPAPPQQFQVSEREREVLTLMVQGFTNRQIATQLSLSTSTVKFHVSSILAKLGVMSRTEAVALAIQHHLVS